MSKESQKPELIVASTAITKLARKLAELKAQRAAIESEESKLKAQLLAKVGDGPGIEGKDFVLTTSVSTSVAWKSVAEEVGFPKSVVEKHTKIGSPHLVCAGPLFKGERAADKAA